jgi:hypothetical protein
MENGKNERVAVDLLKLKRANIPYFRTKQSKTEGERLVGGSWWTI